MLEQTPGIVTDLGFLTRQLASSWYMSLTQGRSMTALLVSILISLTAIIAKTTWEQRFLTFKWAEMSRNRRSLSEVHVIATSRKVTNTLFKWPCDLWITLWSINSNIAECHSFWYAIPSLWNGWVSCFPCSVSHLFVVDVLLPYPDLIIPIGKLVGDKIKLHYLTLMWFTSKSYQNCVVKIYAANGNLNAPNSNWQCMQHHGTCSSKLEYLLNAESNIFREQSGLFQFHLGAESVHRMTFRRPGSGESI
jgi:hypothetical protein